MVDIHSHILYGLDDGAETLEESLAMLTMAAARGTTDIVASPHANHTYFYAADLVDARITELRNAMGAIRIHRGCDFHLSFDNIQDAMARPSHYTINGGRYLLVEFSDLLIPKATSDVFAQMMEQAGIVPVITHPERNPILQRRMADLERWAASGVRLQVTAGSLLGRFGKSAKAAADTLMTRNLVHFVASDAHDTKHRTPDLREAYEEVERIYGGERARVLFVDYPRAVVENRVFEPPPAAVEAAPKPWWRLW